VFVAGAAGLVIGWVHQREHILQWWEEAQEAAKASAAGRDDRGDDADEETR
jgi:hypothetical protein